MTENLAVLLVQSSSLCVRLPDLFFRTARRWSNTFRNFFHPYLSSVRSVWSVSDPQCDIYHHFMLWLASCEVSEEPRFDPLSQDRWADCSIMTAVKSSCPLTSFPRPWLKISWGQGKKFTRTYIKTTITLCHYVMTGFIDVGETKILAAGSTFFYIWPVCSFCVG